jgi:hypothetical protein
VAKLWVCQSAGEAAAPLPIDAPRPVSPWAGCLACQPGCLAGWLAHFPTSVFGLLTVLDEFPHFSLFILELHTAFLSNQLFYFLTLLCLSSGYYIKTLLGRQRKSSLSSLQYLRYVENVNLHVAKYHIPTNLTIGKNHDAQ